MKLSEVKRLVAGGESETVEFKRKAAHPEKIVKELVAFANTHGGYLFLGVSDDGSIPGLKFPEDEIFALDQAIKKYCKPSFKYTNEITPISENRSVVTYYIPSSKKRPHYVITDFETKWGQAFIRVEDKSIKASREVREILKRATRNKDIQFTYGDKEKILLDYLDKHENITLTEFKKLARLNNYKASKTLIILVLANVLKVEPNEKSDIYKLKYV